MRLFASIAVLLTAASGLSAQASAGWVALQGGYISQSADSGLKSSPTVGIGLGGWFTNRFGIELSVLDSRIKNEVTAKKGGETQGAVSGLFNFNSGGTSFFPFVRLGTGMTTLTGELKVGETSRRVLYQAGLGVQGHFGEHLIGLLEIRGVRIGKNKPVRNETMGLLGLGYRWGGSSPVGKASPSNSEPQSLSKPLVEALPTLPGQPAVEVLPTVPQHPAVEVQPMPSRGPMVEALPTGP